MTDLVAEALAGGRRALARLLSVVEDDAPAAGGARAGERAAILRRLYPLTGRAHIVGITGAPGSGKSTLVGQLAAALRGRALTVGIVAVDPTSPFSGGALLGDRIRMRTVSDDPGVFIRSMASRGSLGGLARGTGNVVQVLDACGYDTILIETVGAGQVEVDIARAAHTTVVIQVPEAGDDVQMLKAGILEIADILVVNKADRPGADRVAAALALALERSGGPKEESGPSWHPPILKTVATTGEGVAGLADALAQHREHLRAGGGIVARERARLDEHLRGIVREWLLELALTRAGRARYEELLARLMAREIDPYEAANDLLAAAGLGAPDAPVPGPTDAGDDAGFRD